MGSLENEQDLVPINRVKSKGIDIDLDLPKWVPTDLIGLDLEELRKLCDYAGVARMTVRMMDPHQEVDSTMVLDPGPDGTARGGFVQTKTAQNQIDIAPFGRHHNKYKPATTVDAQIGLNRTAIYHSVQKNGEHGARSPEAWVKILDQELRAALQEAGLKHLLAKHIHSSDDPRSSPQDESIFTLMTSAALLLGIGVAYPLAKKIKNDVNYIDLIGFIFNMILIYQVRNFVIYFHSKKVSDKPRLSLVNPCGIELDRALIFWVMIQTKSLVRSIVPDHT